MKPDAATARTPADIARAIRVSPVFTPRTVHECRRVALGIALAAHIRATPALLARGATTAERWIASGDRYVPRSLRDWQTLCTAGDVDIVLLALEAMTEYADEMRVSHPLVGILDDGDIAVIRALARGEEPGSRIPLAVWQEIARLVGTHFGPVELLAMCATPQPMLTDIDGRERTVVAALEAGDYEAVYALFRWITTDPDADAPRITDLAE